MTKQSLTAAINILKAANWRSKNVRDAVSHLKVLRRKAPFDAIDWSNFHDATSAMFFPCAVPARQPDFISASGSIYWNTTTGVVRASDHWGMGIRSCNWYLDRVGDRLGFTCERYFIAVGYCPYSEFRNGLVWPQDFEERAA